MFSHCVNITSALLKITRQDSECLNAYYLSIMKYELYNMHVISQNLSQKHLKPLFKYLSKMLDIPNDENLIKNFCRRTFEKIPEFYQNDVTKQDWAEFWVGHRLSNTMVTNDHDMQKNICYEMVNLYFYSDNRYHQYPYWESLTQDFTFNNLNFFKSKKYNNAMPIACLNPDDHPNLGVIPSPMRARNIIRPLSYIWHWEDCFYQKINGETGNNGN
jgi:hypothetical protein